jgi:hypothetical protein
LGHRRRKIIATGFGKLEKCRTHDGADRVAADVFSIGVAATVTKEARLGLRRADVKPVAEDIPRRARATSTVSAVVPQHCRLLDRRHCPVDSDIRHGKDNLRFEGIEPARDMKRPLRQAGSAMIKI